MKFIQLAAVSILLSSPIKCLPTTPDLEQPNTPSLMKSTQDLHIDALAGSPQIIQFQRTELTPVNVFPSSPLPLILSLPVEEPHFGKRSLTLATLMASAPALMGAASSILPMLRMFTRF